MKPKKSLEIDGRTGEGGGQLVRLSCALAAATSQPIRITHVRGNRDRGGGLKAQHVSSVRWLAEATGGEVEGLSVGSRTLEFRSSAPPTALEERKIQIVADSSAASTLLIFQAVFPYLLFAANENGDPIELEIQGGTNVSFSLSYEYLDQVLLPTLQDRFGIKVERELRARSWAVGPKRMGSIWLKFQPIPRGQTLKHLQPWDNPLTEKDFTIKQIDVSMLVPNALREPLEKALARDLDNLFPDVDINFVLMEESGHDARMYTLLVAHSETGQRWGRDFLYNRAWKKKTPETLSAEISREVCKQLAREIATRGVVDEYLQDQLVVFQALAEGRTSFHRGDEPADMDAPPTGAAKGGDQLSTSMDGLKLEKRMRKDRMYELFGEGSTHTTTARWVACELLPTVQWYNKGSICDGAGVSFAS
ncbi:Uu.00g113830.m01.CDS01 [Anthostomella pinea]|uniref:Uu.00g113830.m01.CDS01 n=1 Tax=Anthostomella pinea TaxID=933095 RepID=A0AAI8YGK5_9PEZI|nr:Uu.00g113830.m01.CDS01 [Anthostomella pinea]